MQTSFIDFLTFWAIFKNTFLAISKIYPFIIVSFKHYYLFIYIISKIDPFVITGFKHYYILTYYLFNCLTFILPLNITINQSEFALVQ